ncbi:MAG: RNA polymerase sigma factor [Deltaproteobacteria bacterium]|nr:RNA polymerase sigma factor [Deltaproteobacteria bacterium]
MGKTFLSLNMRHESSSQTDADIVERILSGDVNAFDSLMARHGDHVLRIVKRHVPLQDVEDVAQQAFIRAYRSLTSFAGGGNFRQWLSTIAVRTCYDYWRGRYRSREIPMCTLTDRHGEWLEGILSERSDRIHEEEGAQREAVEVLEWGLAQLSPEDRMVLELVYLEGLSGKEAAGLLGWSVANVKVRAFRSRKRLEKLLRERFQE